MRNKANMSRTDEMRAQTNKCIPHASISESEDTNAMRVDSERHDQLSHLDVDVVGDVIEQMEPLASCKLFIAMSNGDAIAFMSFVVSTPNVDRRPSTMVWAFILKPHGRRNVGLRIDGKVRHWSSDIDGEGARRGRR
jgi:hypothetical protein